MILEGGGVINGQPFCKGDSILLPAAMEQAVLEGEATYLQII